MPQTSKELLSQEVSEVDQHVTAIIGELQNEEAKMQKAATAIEMEAVEARGTNGAASSRDQHRAADAQKERAHAALLSAAQSDRERLAGLQVLGAIGCNSMGCVHAPTMQNTCMVFMPDTHAFVIG